jgi:hypothetical protein
VIDKAAEITAVLISGSVSCYNRIQLQEFNIAIGFIDLCVKGFMCSSYGSVLNEVFCISEKRS